MQRGYRSNSLNPYKSSLVFVLLIWLGYGLSLLVSIKQYGLIPRTLHGLSGILTMPFLHGSLSHLIGNTVPLVVLLVLLSASRARPFAIALSIVLVSGALLWCFGRPALHIGASVLIFGLMSFLLLSGFLEQRLLPLLVSLFVGLTYGIPLFLGILPGDPGISWDGHLFGAVAGVLVAYTIRGAGYRRRHRRS